MALAIVRSDAEPKSVASLDVLEFIINPRQNAKNDVPVLLIEPCQPDIIEKTGVSRLIPVPACDPSAGYSLSGTLPINAIVTKGLQPSTREDADMVLQWPFFSDSCIRTTLSRLFIS
jgi:hypothetical protein